ETHHVGVCIRKQCRLLLEFGSEQGKLSGRLIRSRLATVATLEFGYLPIDRAKLSLQPLDFAGQEVSRLLRASRPIASVFIENEGQQFVGDPHGNFGVLVFKANTERDRDRIASPPGLVEFKRHNTCSLAHQIEQFGARQSVPAARKHLVFISKRQQILARHDALFDDLNAFFRSRRNCRPDELRRDLLGLDEELTLRDINRGQKHGNGKPGAGDDNKGEEKIKKTPPQDAENAPNIQTWVRSIEMRLRRASMFLHHVPMTLKIRYDLLLGKWIKNSVTFGQLTPPLVVTRGAPGSPCRSKRPAWRGFHC